MIPICKFSKNGDKYVVTKKRLVVPSDAWGKRMEMRDYKKA